MRMAWIRTLADNDPCELSSHAKHVLRKPYISQIALSLRIESGNLLLRFACGAVPPDLLDTCGEGRGGRKGVRPWTLTPAGGKTKRRDSKKRRTKTLSLNPCVPSLQLRPNQGDVTAAAAKPLRSASGFEGLGPRVCSIWRKHQPKSQKDAKLLNPKCLKLVSPSRAATQATQTAPALTFSTGRGGPAYW